MCLFFLILYHIFWKKAQEKAHAVKPDIDYFSNGKPNRMKAQCDPNTMRMQPVCRQQCSKHNHAFFHRLSSNKVLYESSTWFWLNIERKWDKMRALSRKKSKAILALLQNLTVNKAAESIGVGQRTLFRWMQDHNFQQHYLQAKRKVIELSISHL